MTLSITNSWSRLSQLTFKFSNLHDLKTKNPETDLVQFAKAKTLSQVKQIHSSKIFDIKTMDHTRNKVEADAMITNLKGVTLAIKTADCVPILLFDDAINVIGAIHSGWRGTKESIVKKTIALMNKNYHSNPKDISALIGPAINPCCYEVQKDLKDIFESFEGAIENRNGKTFLNLKAIIAKDLRESGIENIENISECTCCTPDLYPSYRRDKTDQRIFSIITLK
jgi:YfiH family protein